jgi:cell division protein FtsB
MTMRQKIFLSLAMLVILSTSLLIVFGENGFIDHQRLDIRHEHLVGENEAITRENARLYRQIDRLKNDPGFIENIARRDLGMIGRREIIVKPLKPIESERGVHRPAVSDNRTSEP